MVIFLQPPIPGDRAGPLGVSKVDGVGSRPVPTQLSDVSRLAGGTFCVPYRAVETTVNTSLLLFKNSWAPIFLLGGIVL